MKVYIVLKYRGEQCKVDSVYLCTYSATARRDRLQKKEHRRLMNCFPNRLSCGLNTYHIIKKTIKGVSANGKIVNQLKQSLIKLLKFYKAN